MQQDAPSPTSSASQSNAGGGSPAGASSGGAGAAAGQVRSALRGQSLAAQEATLAPRSVQMKGGAAVQRRHPTVRVGTQAGFRGNVPIPELEVYRAAFPGFTTTWTVSGGCGFAVSFPDEPRSAGSDVEVAAQGGPIDLRDGGEAEPHEEPRGPEAQVQLSPEEVEAEVKQEVMGGLFEVGGGLKVGEHGAGGGISASCRPGSVRLGNGVTLRVPALDFKLANYNPQTHEIEVCRLETTLPIMGAEFTIHRPSCDIKITPAVNIKVKIDPNWLTIAEEMGLELAADATMAEAAALVAVDILGYIAAPAAGAAMLFIAAHEFEEGDQLIAAALDTASNVYSYCHAYAQSWMNGRPSHGPGGRAAQRDMEAARHANPGLQVAAQAAMQGEEQIYTRVFEMIGPRAIDALKARVRSTRFLRGSEETTIEDRVGQARWGGNIWRLHGAVASHASSDRNGDESRREPGAGGGGDGERGGRGGHGQEAEHAAPNPSAGVTANEFDPEQANLTDQGRDLARIHADERRMLHELDAFKRSALMYERHGDGASATLTRLITHYRGYIPKVLALRALYRRLRVSEEHWKVSPHYTHREEYDPDLTWAKSLAEATVGALHPNDPRIAAIDGFRAQLTR